MKEDLMEVVAILDMSGSMSSLTQDTIGGYNGYVYDLLENKMAVKITLIVFDDKSVVVYSHLDIKEVPILTTKVYMPDGGTALTDAMGIAIQNMKAHIQQLPEDQKPGAVSFFITTDGEENSSKQFTKQQVKEMVTKTTEEDKWVYIFAGSNIDAFAAGNNYGIQQQNIANIANNGFGYQNSYKAVAMNNCMQMRSNLQMKIDKGEADENTQQLMENLTSNVVNMVQQQKKQSKMAMQSAPQQQYRSNAYPMQCQQQLQIMPNINQAMIQNMQLQQIEEDAQELRDNACDFRQDTTSMKKSNGILSSIGNAVGNIFKKKKAASNMNRNVQQFAMSAPQMMAAAPQAPVMVQSAMEEKQILEANKEEQEEEKVDIKDLEKGLNFQQMYDVMTGK